MGGWAWRDCGKGHDKGRANSCGGVSGEGEVEAESMDESEPWLGDACGGRGAVSALAPMPASAPAVAGGARGSMLSLFHRQSEQTTRQVSAPWKMIACSRGMRSSQSAHTLYCELERLESVGGGGAVEDGGSLPAEGGITSGFWPAGIVYCLIQQGPGVEVVEGKQERRGKRVTPCRLSCS